MRWQDYSDKYKLFLLEDNYKNKNKNKNKKNEPHSRRNSVEESVRISRKLADQLRAGGVKAKRMKGEEFYGWMSNLFNSKSKPKDLSYSTSGQKLFVWNLTENVFFNALTSFAEGWLFDGLPHSEVKIAYDQTANANYLLPENKN